MHRSLRVPLVIATAAVATTALSACGSQGIELSKANPNYRGAELFAYRCSGCHTLAAAGAQGSGTAFVKEKTDGPNLDTRKETVSDVLYAIRNGGFSAAIMPQNIVVGSDAKAVAKFVAKYAGQQAKSPEGPTGSPPNGF